MNKLVVVAWALVLATAGLGCGESEEEGPNMSPGQDCLACHMPVGSASESVFSAAGTVYDVDGNPAAGVTVLITDSMSRTASDVTTMVGNFYFTQELTPPLQVTISSAAGSVSMSDATGACNSCHGLAGTTGPIIYQ